MKSIFRLIYGLHQQLENTHSESNSYWQSECFLRGEKEEKMRTMNWILIDFGLRF